MSFGRGRRIQLLRRQRKVSNTTVVGLFPGYTMMTLTMTFKLKNILTECQRKDY